MVYERSVVAEVDEMIRKGPPLLQVLIGPRQTGKTTAAIQILGHFDCPNLVAAADALLPPGPEWVETQWTRARVLARSGDGQVILVLDEIQKVRGWSEEVKRLWDEDRRLNLKISVLLLGSSSLLIQKGLSESLTGRFYLHRCPHWSWRECRQAFGWSLEEWIYFGGYPGAAPLKDRPLVWKQYIADSLIETVISRDVLQLQSVSKPALLRHLFALAAYYPAQIFSYNKMLGQLQDAGNTTTLAHYLKLLETAFLVSGLESYAKGRQRKRGSSPKLVLWNPGLVTALLPKTFEQLREDPSWWGRLVENAVGAHLLNHLPSREYEIYYWRERNAEVDFVVTCAGETWALEVKSGRADRMSGIEMFRKKYPGAKALVIGSTGIPLDEFLGDNPKHFLM